MTTSDQSPITILGDNQAVLYQAMMNEHIPDIAPESLDESLTIQLAVFVHNGEYSLARQLYRRYHDSHNTDYFDTEHSSIEIVFPMFYSLWKALEPLFLIHAFEVKHHNSNRESYSSKDDVNGSSMCSLAKVYDHLKSCQLRRNDFYNPSLIDSLAGELLISTRDKVLFMIESGVFDAIRDSSAVSLLGFSDYQSTIEFCKKRGWEVESIDNELYLIPFVRKKINTATICENGKSRDKIEQLTRLVGFLEVERLNA